MIGDRFESFCSDIKLGDVEDMQASASEIAKKLNKEFYGLEFDGNSHIYFVGSVGRGTAIENVSDLDLLFDMPESIFEKYDSYASNGQSELLQAVKEVLEERYPRTKIRGDGQVVVIDFEKYKVELMPAFRNNDGSFKYPDTHNGGSWKKTNPLAEQKACDIGDCITNGLFRNFCHMMRGWKNNQGFKFKGLLIDTLVYEYFEKRGFCFSCDYEQYLDLVGGLFEYLGSQDKKQKYWHALGSNQHVYGSGNEAFVRKAREASNFLREATTEEGILNALQEIFGSSVFECEIEEKRCSYDDTEEFVEKKFSLDVRYDMKVGVTVYLNGWRPMSLLGILSKSSWICGRGKIEFVAQIEGISGSYQIYWKVRNVGEEAERRNMIRGEIVRGENIHLESLLFFGPHYVECYIVKDGICVARKRINVPIGEI